MRACIIVVENVVIGEDIAETVKTRHPDLQPYLFRRLEDALAAWPAILSAQGTIVAAIIAAQLGEIDASGLGARLAEAATPVVLVSSRPETLDREGWKVLPLPFSESMLLHLLDDA